MDEPGPDWRAATPGAAITAVFPGMAGKVRPGVVAFVGASGLVAAPLTTRPGRQDGSLAPEPEELSALGARARSRLLPPCAAYLPAARVLSLGPGALSPAGWRELKGMLEHWFGAGWRGGDPAFRPPAAKARRLTPRSRKARRADEA
ncbi:MAG: hypothetical protein AAFR16_11890 [Pseudomonadota bacterium]